MRELIIDGVPLRDPLGEWFVDYTRSKTLPEVSRELTTDQAYGFHGLLGAAPPSYFGTSKETWVINVLGADKDDRDVNVRGLIGLLGRQELSVLAAPQRSPLASSARYGQTFAGSVSADVQRTARMRLFGSIAEERIDESTTRLTAILENLNTFWRSTLLYPSAAFAMTASTVTATLDSVLADSSADVNDGQVRIKGPISVGGTITVQDRANPFRAITYTATTALAATEYVVIDLITLRARLQTSAVWSLTGGTDVGVRVTSSGDGGFSLTPNPGTGFPAGPWSYSASLLGVGHSASTTVEFQLRRSYLA